MKTTVDQFGLTGLEPAEPGLKENNRKRKYAPKKVSTVPSAIRSIGNLKVGKFQTYRAKTVAEATAISLYNVANFSKNDTAKVAAAREINERVEGKAPSSKEDRQNKREVAEKSRPVLLIGAGLIANKLLPPESYLSDRELVGTAIRIDGEDTGPISNQAE